MTRSKAPLAMIELLIMLPVLAFCAAACLQGLAWSANQSKILHQKQEAMSVAVSLSDAVRSKDEAAFDALDIPAALEHDIYDYRTGHTGLFVSIVHSRQNPYLLQTDITITDKNGTEIYAISVNSQY